MSFLESTDPEIAQAIKQEERRQRCGIELIAAENYTSRSILEAQGSVLTNKYAEGYPGHRYYGGCVNMDAVESLAIERARILFGAEHANVQPHSGAQANMATYFALVHPGDTVMGMSLAHGGHLTHGSPANYSGIMYRIVAYGVNKETEMLDYDMVEKQAQECRPKLIMVGASAYPRIIDFARFRCIADSVGATMVVDMAHLAGLVAAKLHPSPVPHAHVVTSTTHKTLRGPRGGFILCRADLGPKIDKAVFPGVQGGPLMHVVAAKAVAFHEAMQPSFVEYQKAVLENAQVLAAELKRLGLRIVSGGTENHLVLIDLTATGATGKAAEEALDAVGITVNKNAIPFDTRPPGVCSGLRLGTPAVTSRGFRPDDIRQVARILVNVLAHPGDGRVALAAREEVAAITARFPVPGTD